VPRDYRLAVATRDEAERAWPGGRANAEWEANGRPVGETRESTATGAPAALVDDRLVVRATQSTR